MRGLVSLQYLLAPPPAGRAVLTEKHLTHLRAIEAVKTAWEPQTVEHEGLVSLR